MIRPAQDTDRRAIANLHIASWRAAYTADLSADYLAGPVVDDLHARWDQIELGGKNLVLVAERDGQLQGFAMVECGTPPFMNNLHISPNQRGQGLGTALLASTAQDLLDDNFSRLELSVLANNKAAYAFYLAKGAVPLEEMQQPVFGQSVPAYRLAFTDLGALAAR